MQKSDSGVKTLIPQNIWHVLMRKQWYGNAKQPAVAGYGAQSPFNVFHFHVLWDLWTICAFQPKNEKYQPDYLVHKWFSHIKVHTQVFTYKLILTTLVVTSVNTNRAACFPKVNTYKLACKGWTKIQTQSGCLISLF